MKIELLTNIPAYKAVAGDVIDVPPSFAKRWESQNLAKIIGEEEAGQDVEADAPEVDQEPEAEEAEEVTEDEADAEDEVEEDPVEEEVKGLKAKLKRGGKKAESAEAAEVIEERG